MLQREKSDNAALSVYSQVAHKRMHTPMHLAYQDLA